jgi:hypothetical protein
MWYYTLNNQQYGPVDEAKIKELVANGSVNLNTMVWTAGMGAWAPITQTTLASLLGNLPPAPPPVYYPAVALKDPEVKQLDDLFMWFWICLAGSLITFGISALVSVVLFFVIIYKAWQAVQHEGIRCTADQAVAYCGIPGWNFYWIFPAFKGLAREMNDVLGKENIAAEPVSEETALWFNIMILAAPLGITVIPLIIFWIIYTNKVKKTLIAIITGRKAK